MLRTVNTVLSGMLLMIVLSAVTFGQAAGTATLIGMVRDVSGLLVPGVRVEAVNTETNLTFTAMTNESGFYTLSNMPPGEYTLTIEKQGFERILKNSVDLHVADNISINFALEIGAVEQTVTVSQGAPLVNTTSSSLGGLVQSAEIQTMPLNGRNYINLTLMQPGVAPSPNVTTGGTYNGTWYSSNGATMRSNNFTLDGAIMQDANGGSTANFAGRTLGLDGIQEYRVITSAFPAEYGLLSGSQTVMVSKSGTNRFHGSVFEYLRNSAMDAANYFDRPTLANNFARIAPLKRNNFGGSIGGPIRKDKTFFFVTYEQLEERLGVTVNNTVPAAGCHAGAGSVITNTACPQLGSTKQVTVAPAIAPLLALYPLPNLPNDAWTTPYTQPETDLYGQVRVDHLLTSRDSVFTRYTIDDDDQVAALQFPNSFVNLRDSRHQLITFSENHIFSPSLMNNFRASFSRTASTRLSPSPFIGQQYSLLPGMPMGQITIGGFASFGPQTNSTSLQTQNITSFSDDITYTRGNHSTKFGTLINSYRQYANQSNRVWGQLQFSSLSNFLSGTSSSYAASLPGSLTDRTCQFYTTGFYAQDDWRIRSNLTVNAGLRYEPSPNYYTEVHGKGSAITNPLTDSGPVVGPYFKNPTWKNISPRLGFAWDVFGNGKTAFRAGAALMYDIGNLYNGFVNLMLQQLPFSYTNSGSGAFTIPLTFAANSTTAVQSTQEYLMRQARFYDENVSIEQQLPFAISLTVSYAGSRGIHLPSITDANPNLPLSITNGVPVWNPVTTQSIVRTNPKLSSVLERDSSGDSIYHSLQVQLNRRATSRLQFHSAFTWSKALDNGYGLSAADATATSLYPSNPYNRRFDRGPSQFNVPRIWVSDFNYAFPLPNTNVRVVAVLTKGWGMTGIFTIHDGLPFNPVVTGNRSRSGLTGGLTTGIDRPNYNPSFSGPVITGNPDQWFNPAAFILQPVGILGNVERDSLMGPGYTNFDFGLHKNTKVDFLGESGNVQFRVEAFNILNHPNLGMPNINTFAGSLTDAVTAAPLSTAGQITSTAGTSRQIELALRISF